MHSLALGHRHPALAFAAAHGGVYRRDENGAWSHVLAQGEIWSVAVLPDDRSLIAGNNDGTVDLSVDAGRSWRHVQVSSGGVYAVSLTPGEPRRVLAGAVGGIFLSTDGGLRWQRRLALPNSAGAAFAWKPSSGRIVFAGAVAGQSGGSTDVFVSRDAGATWHVLGRHLNSTGGIMSLAVTPATEVFAGTMGNAVWKVVGGRGTWRKSAEGMPPTNDHVAGIASVPGQPKTLFAATLGHGVFRSDDGGVHWTDISSGLSASRNANIVLSLVYSSSDRSLLAGTGDGVYRLEPALK